MNTKLLRLFLIILLAGLSGYFIGVSKVSFEWKNYNPKLTIINKEPPASLGTVDLAMFWTVWERLKSNYYDKQAIDPQKLVNGAISGMVQSIGDPYTVYLPPVQNQDFKQGLAGQFTGIGAELGMRGKQIIVVAPLDNMPAQKAGIKAGDAIVKVDDQSTAGWTLAQAVDKIRGPKGTSVSLSIVRKDDDKPKDLKVTRDVITVKSVDSWVKNIKDIDTIKIANSPNAQVAYIRLSQFGDNTNQEWLTMINSLTLAMQSKPVKGVILDLRNNPGGYLNDAAFIASEFIKSGTVVMEEKGTGERIVLSVKRQGLLTDIPVVVLINKGSASASEIVAGALRDHNRATLVGEVSFGKGTVQEAEDLGGGAGLHVTIAKWLTPNGTWVHGKGLTPDVAVALDEKDPSHDLQLEKAVQQLLK